MAVLYVRAPPVVSQATAVCAHANAARLLTCVPFCFGCAGVCEAAAYSDVVMHSVEEEQASGGHSHNCHAPEPCAHGDEREVDSAQQTGEQDEC